MIPSSPAFLVLVHLSALLAMGFTIALVYAFLKYFFNPSMHYASPLEEYHNDRALQAPRRPFPTSSTAPEDATFAIKVFPPSSPRHDPPIEDQRQLTQDYKDKTPHRPLKPSTLTPITLLEQLKTQPHFILGRYVHPQTSLWAIKYLQAFRHAQECGDFKLVKADVEADLASGLLGRVKATESIPMDEWEGIVWM